MAFWHFFGFGQVHGFMHAAGFMAFASPRLFWHAPPSMRGARQAALAGISGLVPLSQA